MSKYRNVKTEIDNIWFDSKREASRYLVLRDMLNKGEISDLRMQVEFELIPAIYRNEIKHLKTKDKVVKKLVQRAICYIADFVYINVKTGEEVVEDSKGKRTKEYLLKKKMMFAFNNIMIQEV